ncbi:MAG: hypothetical protein A2580_11670 [Hydrogenophilales bacterium RIFOXYD1_FULL_62_11]|nr:MAG: hypothetical protein A2580_11670 [Hydrogenophilales bacterium RIFOXYD1_FULL_62_11]
MSQLQRTAYWCFRRQGSGGLVQRRLIQLYPSTDHPVPKLVVDKYVVDVNDKGQPTGSRSRMSTVTFTLDKYSDEELAIADAMKLVHDQSAELKRQGYSLTERNDLAKQRDAARSGALKRKPKAKTAPPVLQATGLGLIVPCVF